MGEAGLRKCGSLADDFVRGIVGVVEGGWRGKAGNCFEGIVEKSDFVVTWNAGAEKGRGGSCLVGDASSRVLKQVSLMQNSMCRIRA